MYDTPLTTEQVLALLAKTPGRIAALSAGLPPDRLRDCPAPEEWSANEVLAHLRSCGDVWGRHIALILSNDNPTIRALSPRTWMRRTNYLDQEFLPSLQAFTAQRADLLAILTPLTPEAWTRSATVLAVGKSIVRSVHTYAQMLANHEQSHIRQIERTVLALPDEQRDQRRQPQLAKPNQDYGGSIDEYEH